MGEVADVEGEGDEDGPGDALGGGGGRCWEWFQGFARVEVVREYRKVRRKWNSLSG
jgi:hypothetical protein